jgi:transcriptional regulator GlxA family with amidase domain
MKKIGLVIFPGFQALDLSVLTPFELANSLAPKPVYELAILSETGGMVSTTMGVSVDSKAFGPDAADTLLIGGSTSIPTASPGLLKKLRAVAPRTRRIGSVCTGAFILAETGLLDGRQATTHWYAARDFQMQFPAVKVMEDRIYTTDEGIWTSAGMTACIDMALAMLSDDLGSEMSRAIARKMVVYHQRPGGQSQFSALLELEPRSDRIRNVFNFIKRNLRSELSVEQLADVAHLSPRQFTRIFQTETGQSPARAVERIRVESARILIESGGHTIERVAEHTGFDDTERMRRAFRRILGQPPQSFKPIRSNGKMAA